VSEHGSEPKFYRVWSYDCAGGLGKEIYAGHDRPTLKGELRPHAGKILPMDHTVYIDDTGTITSRSLPAGLVSTAYTKGREAGYNQGRAEGRAERVELEKKVEQLTADLGMVETCNRILKEDNRRLVEKLDRWNKHVCVPHSFSYARVLELEAENRDLKLDLVTGGASKNVREFRLTLEHIVAVCKAQLGRFK